MSINEKNKDDDNIKVILRIRPKNQNESKTNNFFRIDHLNNILYINTPTNKKYYNFDYIASEETNQTEIFMKSAKNICDYVLEGYNGTIFVYGQTGSGKTYTLLGPKYASSSLNLSKKNFNNFYNDKNFNNNNLNNINFLSKNNNNDFANVNDVNVNFNNNNNISDDSNSLSNNSEK